MENVIVIKHPIHFFISDLEVHETIEAIGNLNLLHIVTLEPARFTIKETSQRNFGELALHQATAWRRELSRDLGRGHTVAYFGLAPIPLSVHLGRLLGSRNKAIVFNLSHDSKTWFNPQPIPELILTGLPERPVLATGEVVFRISISFQVSQEETRVLINAPLCEVDLSVPMPEREAILCPDGSTHVAIMFRKAVDQIVQYFPSTLTL